MIVRSSTGDCNAVVMSKAVDVRSEFNTGTCDSTGHQEEGMRLPAVVNNPSLSQMACGGRIAHSDEAISYNHNRCTPRTVWNLAWQDDCQLIRWSEIMDSERRGRRRKMQVRRSRDGWKEKDAASEV